MPAWAASEPAFPVALSGNPNVEVVDCSCMWRSFSQALVSAAAQPRIWELERWEAGVLHSYVKGASSGGIGPPLGHLRCELAV